MKLTDTKIRSTKPLARDYKLSDGGGLYLLITPAGGKLWRLKFRTEGREKKLAIGSYPEISLGDARRRRDEARALLAAGKDPSREKQRERCGLSFKPKTPLRASLRNTARSASAMGKRHGRLRRPCAANICWASSTRA